MQTPASAPTASPTSSTASTRRKRSGEGGSPPAGGEPAVRVRHYCQGIGDCHLLRFARPGGGFFSVLIDCGVHGAVAGGTKIMRSVVEDIASVTERIDVLVVTHEHWDHVSGFMTAADEIGKARRTDRGLPGGLVEPAVDRERRRGAARRIACDAPFGPGKRPGLRQHRHGAA